MADVFEHLNALNRGGVDQLDIQTGLEARDASFNWVRLICESHVVDDSIPIITEEVVVKADPEDFRVNGLMKCVFLTLSFQEALTSVHPLEETSIPVSQGVPLKPLFFRQVAPLKLVLEVL